MEVFDNFMVMFYIHGLHMVLLHVYFYSSLYIILILLNRLSLPHPFLTVNQSDSSMLFVHKLNDKQCRPVQRASTLFAMAMSVMLQQGKG